jgi:hypothetical protein
MKTQKTMPPSKLTMARRIELYELLKERLVKQPDGLFRYEDSYSDQRIAAIAGGDATAPQIRGIRVQLFGKLCEEDKAPYIHLPELVKRFLTLEKEVATLKNSLGG